MRKLLFVCACFCYGELVAQNPWKNVYSEHAWIERDRWQKPEALMRMLGAGPGDIVADVGCHEGYMTFKLAKLVGDRGLVYAVDIDQAKLDKVTKRAQASDVKNIRVIKGTVDDPKLPGASVDCVLILDTYHEMDNPAEILQHIKASLKKGGKLLICEPIADERRALARSEQQRKHELALKYAVDDLREAGFRITYQKDNFVDRTSEKGDRMWVLVGEKI